MSRPVQIVVTLVLFTALMLGFWAILKPIVGVSVDWLAARIGIGWVWVLILVLFVPSGLWGYWHSYKAGKADRTRSP